MNWVRIIIAGVGSGVVATIANYVMHGFIMASAYTKYEAFAVEEQANPAHFFLVGICVGIMASLLFARTRSSWAPGLAGGVTFGFFLGLAVFFLPFYNSMVIAGFPYHLSWCWGGIDLIQFVVYGAMIGLIYKEK